MLDNTVTTSIWSPTLTAAKFKYSMSHVVIADPSEQHDANEIIRVVYGANYLKIKSAAIP
jgi:hypothetical protein